MSISLQTRNTNSDFPLVAPLTDFDRNSLAVVGGKGANLGELIKAGFDVPPGFVITTAAYDLLLQANDPQRHIQTVLASLRTDDPASVKEVSTQMYMAIQTGSGLTGLAERVGKHGGHLEAGPHSMAGIPGFRLMVEIPIKEPLSMDAR
jgi:hypothetical protein